MAKLRAWCESVNLCVRCYLRFAFPAGTARGCLGVLSDTVLDSVPAEALASISKREILHDGRYKVTAAFPASAAHVRERSLWIAWKAEFPSLSTSTVERPHSLREAFKLALADRLSDVGLRYDADASLFIDVVFRHATSDKECGFLADEDVRVRKSKGQKLGKRPRYNANGSNIAVASTAQITRVLKDIDDVAFRKIAPVNTIPPAIPECPVESKVTVSVANLLLAGEYNKYSRVVSQTPWLVGKTRNPKRYEKHGGNNDINNYNDNATGDPSEKSKIPPPSDYATSVEQVVTAGMQDVFRAGSITFTSGGREDVDVRCLGAGRPFVVELANPRIVESLVTDEMLAQISRVSASTSTAVGVRNLRVAPRQHFAQMRVCEGERRKRYRCVVWTERPIEEATVRRKLEDVEGGFLLFQKTPLRVLHRRTLLVRERQIFAASVFRYINRHFFILDVEAQAGTYIKEFVHGDNGRTRPNVGLLLESKAEILQLDVLEVGDKT